MKQFFFLLFLLGIIKNSDAQNVGIGTPTPNTSALLDITSTNKGLLIPRMTTSQRLTISTPANGLMVYDTDKNEFYHYNGTGWRSILNGEYWSRGITSRSRIGNSTDSVGIGILSPTQWLDVDGNIRTRNNLLADNNVVATGIVSAGTLNTSGSLFVNGPSSLNGNVTANEGLIINNVGATLQLKDGSDGNKGFFQIAGDDVRFGTNSGNNLGNVIVRMNGNNRFFFTDEGRFTLSADNTPTINFSSGGAPVASLQVQGQDLTINATGNKVRISNVLYADDATNRVGIGTSTPTERLHVSGNTLITGTTTLNGDVTMNAPLVVYDKGQFGSMQINSGDAAGNSLFSFGPNSYAAGLYSGAIGQDARVQTVDNSYVIGTNVGVACDGCVVLADAEINRGFISYGSSLTPNRMYMRFHNGYRLQTGGGTGVLMNNGDNGWSSISDSTKKENYRPVDGNAFLQKIADMKLGSWNYKNQERTRRHYGPMAQEMFANFGSDDIGNIGNDTTIATTDIDGVIMIAIQALVKEKEQQQTQITQLKRELEATLTEMKKLKTMETKLATLIEKYDEMVNAKANAEVKKEQKLVYQE